MQPNALYTPSEDQLAQGPRKLVRPRMPANSGELPKAPRRLRGAAPLAAYAGHSARSKATTAAGGLAEALYFQKQMQAQTPMVFVLEDGEQIHGVIEWFDRGTIKVRNSIRVLIFKHAVKYLYKAGENGA